MSRTDKTRPWTVKLREHPLPVHDHVNGICELRTEPDRVWEPGRQGECYNAAQGWRPEFRCGCLLCTGWQEGERRKRREIGKRQARNFTREYD